MADAEVIEYRFRPRRALAATWVALNDVLLDQELGIEKDTGRMKLGPGAWNSLPYWEGRYVKAGSEPEEGQSLAYDSATGFLEWRDTGKTYLPGTGIDITNPTSSTPTISSTLGSIALSGRKEDYAHLPSSGNSPGDAYLLDSDGLVYVYDGGWPASGKGQSFGSKFRTLAKWTYTTDGTLTAPLEASLVGVNEYQVLFDAVTTAASSYRGVQTSTDGGATWKTSGYQLMTSTGTISVSGLVCRASHAAAANTAITAYEQSIRNDSALSIIRNAQELSSGSPSYIFFDNSSAPINRIRAFGFTSAGAQSNCTGGVITILGR